MPTPARTALIRRYAEGPALIRRTLARVPAEALQWRPASGKWSVHEIILHCADSESHSHGRIRFLLAEPTPLIVGYDQDRWATTLEYHNLPIEAALATIDAVRANTVPLLERVPDEAWSRTGQHSQSGTYTADDWLTIYAEHLEVHARQIDRNLNAWSLRAEGS